ncbi:MAG: hypothetical protein R2911_41880 [Caldilineaceae bacterium]
MADAPNLPNPISNAPSTSLMTMMAIPGKTGDEAATAAFITEQLLAAGAPPTPSKPTMRIPKRPLRATPATWSSAAERARAAASALRPHRHGADLRGQQTGAQGPHRPRRRSCHRAGC